MKQALALSLAAALVAVATPAAAQSNWAGFYAGGHAGKTDRAGGRDALVDFDTNLDGQFGDTVRTSGGANAFSPGFCGGAAFGTTPDLGCQGDDAGSDFGLRAGYDWQSGALVYGVVGEYARGKAKDSVSAFSTTPAFYTLTRELDDTFSVRGRVGFSFGGDRNLVYATGGYAWASLKNSFSTSNTANTFTNTGDSDAEGAQYGVGYERRFGENVSLGVEYLITELTDDEYRVRAQGPAPATNPFILVNPQGTDFRRSDDDFDLGALRMTASYRF